MNSPHLDDEQLSAHLDGEGDEGVPRHVGSCTKCEARLAALAAVVALVAAPVDLPPSVVRDAAVIAADKAWAMQRAGRESRAGTEVVALHRRRLPRWALPLAAAAAAVLVAVPVLSSLRNSKERARTTFAAKDGAADRSSREIAATDGGDLGDQSDPATLGLALREALPGAASEAALAAPAPSATSAAGTTADAASTTVAPGGPTTIPRLARQAAPGSEAKGAQKPFADPPCATIARTTYGKGLGPLVYAALLRWQGEPAVALAYRLADAGAPGLDYRVLVMVRGGCRLLVVQSL